MPAVYRLEVAPNNRAVCRNTECKKAGVKITKGEIRFGTLVEINENQSWHYKHWGCITPANFETWKDITGGDPDLIDGLDELPQPLADKVLRAFEQGHVDDDEWKGDVERNRPGQKGYRTPKGVKKELEKEAAATEAAEKGEESPTKQKAARSKKRKADDDEVDEPPKKGKGRPKKAVKSEAEVEDEGDEVPKKGKGRPKKAIKSEAEAEGEEDEAPKKGRGRLKKAVKSEPEIEADLDGSPPPTKATRGRPKKGASAEAEAPAKKSKKSAKVVKDDAEDAEDAPEPAKKTKKSKAATAATDGEVAEPAEEETKPKAKGRGRPKKAA